jgi:hypothetical protein
MPVIPATWEAEAGESQIRASLDYNVRPCFKVGVFERIKKSNIGPGVVAYICNPNCLGGRDRKITVQVMGKNLRSYLENN